MRAQIPLLLALALFCGCRTQSQLGSKDFDYFLGRVARSGKPPGDFGAVFIEMVAGYGVHAASSSSPELQVTSSHFKLGHDGFEGQVCGVSFEEVQSFMQQVYGSPLSISTNLDKQPYGLYSVQQIGASLQFFGSTNGVGFICLGKRKK
jgi:hypothetical protein